MHAHLLVYVKVIQCKSKCTSYALENETDNTVLRTIQYPLRRQLSSYIKYYCLTGSAPTFHVNCDSTSLLYK